MPTNVIQQYQDAYDMSWRHTTQQGQSKLLRFVEPTAIEGERKRIQFLESVEMTEVTSRMESLTLVEPKTSNRFIYSRKFKSDPHVLDQWDEKELGNLTSPKSHIIEAQSMAYARQIDRLIIDAALGSAYTGEEGTTLTPLGSSQTVAENYAQTGSAVNSGMTFQKITRAAALMDEAELPEGQRVFVVAPEDAQYMLNTIPELKSSDFTRNQIIDKGGLHGVKWMGFDWVVSTLLPKSGNVRSCVAFHQKYVLFADGEKRARISELVERSHAILMITYARMNAMRREEKGVVCVKSYYA